MGYKLLNSNVFNKIFENFDVLEVIKSILDYFLNEFEKYQVIDSGFYKFSKRENKFVKLYPEKNLIEEKTLILLEKSFYNKKIIKQNNFLVIPLIYLDKCIALILFTFKNNKNKINITKYRQVINIFSLIYYNVNIYNLAIKDPLTKLYNKRFFYYKVEEVWEEYKENNKKFSIIMVDIDFFKHYNDKYGHIIGDKILKIVSKKIYDIVNKSGIVARYGGEEFIILLPEKSKNDAYIIGENIRKCIENLKIVNKEYFWRLTVSLGVASYPDDGSEIDEIIKNADKALYYSKENGRNKVSVY